MKKTFHVAILPREAPALLQRSLRPHLRVVLEDVEGLGQANACDDPGNHQENRTDEHNHPQEQEDKQSGKEVLEAIEVCLHAGYMATVNQHHGAVEPKRQRPACDQRAQPKSHGAQHEVDRSVKHTKSNGEKPL